MLQQVPCSAVPEGKDGLPAEADELGIATLKLSQGGTCYDPSA